MKHRASRLRSKLFRTGLFLALVFVVMAGFIGFSTFSGGDGATKRLPKGQFNADFRTFLAMVAYVFTDGSAAEPDPAVTCQPAIVAVNTPAPDIGTSCLSNQSSLHISATTNLPARS